MLFDNFADRNKNALTLLVAQALLPIALSVDPVASIMAQYEDGVIAPSVDFFTYPSTRLTADGNRAVKSPYKENATILVKSLAYMDEAHVDYLLRFPSTPLALDNQQFIYTPLRRLFSKDYLTIPLLQAMLGKGLRVLKREHLTESLPDYGYDITTTTLSIVFDPKLSHIPTSIYMRWPGAVNIKSIQGTDNLHILWPKSMEPVTVNATYNNHNLSHSLYMDEEAWETHY